MTTPTDAELRELDCWIAEHFFGWQKETRKRYGGENNVKGWGINPHLSLGDAKREFRPNWYFPPSYYSNDPAAAMEVLKKCAEKLSGADGGGTSVAVEWLGEIEDGWRVVETDVANGVNVEASTLPEAICLFARALFENRAEGGTL